MWPWYDDRQLGATF